MPCLKLLRRLAIIALLVLSCAKAATAAGELPRPDAVQSVTHSELFKAAPLPSGDPLWDRYSAAVFERASHPPEDLLGWHPALLDEATLLEWSDLSSDPRYWELYHYCLYGQVEYSWQDLAYLDWLVKAEQPERQSQLDWAGIGGDRQVQSIDALWSAVWGSAEDADPAASTADDGSGAADDYAPTGPADLSLAAGASLMPLQVLRARGQASISAELRWLELDSALRQMVLADTLVESEIGHWLGQGQRSAVQLRGLQTSREMEAALDKFSAAHPQVAWAAYARAQLQLGIGDYDGALEQIRLGNAMPVYELPLFFPLSAVAGKLDNFKDPGNLAVAGLVLDSACSDTQPSLLVDDWGLQSLAQWAVLSSDAATMQDLHTFALRLAATRTTDPRPAFSANQILAELAGSYLRLAPEELLGIAPEDRQLLEWESQMKDAGITWGRLKQEEYEQPERGSMQAGSRAYYVAEPAQARDHLWRMLSGQEEKLSPAEWARSYVLERPSASDPRAPLGPRGDYAVASWALDGLASEYLRTVSSAQLAGSYAELIMLDYRRLPALEGWPLKDGETNQRP